MFPFCKPVSSKKRFLPHRDLGDGFTFTLFERADHLPTDDWEQLTGRATVFLEKDYLRIVEDSTYTPLTARYVLLYHNGAPCGLMYFQIVDFRAAVFNELLSGQTDAVRSRRLKVFGNYLDANKDEVLLRLVTCGNNLMSGPYGYRFAHYLPADKAHALLLGITEVVAQEEKLRGGLSAILIKDFYEPLQPQTLFEDEKYSACSVEPNLIVSLPLGLHTLDDYLALFSKKYRNRARAILKSAEGLEVKQLSLPEIKSLEKELFALYEAVFEHAKFRLIKLPPDYFSRVKVLFDREFSVRGWFREGRLIAFSSCFCMPDGSLEAHYIGFDYTLNSTFNLYQNILYAMVAAGIANGCSAVNLGRTAAEIKTTVGAKAHNLCCYIKPQNAISKWIQKPFIAFLQPGEWTPRNPFKEEVPQA